MTIHKIQEDTKLTVLPEGRLDTTTAPELEKELGDLAGVTELVINLKDLQYISSAGLRVFLRAQKAMSKKGSMVVTNVNSVIAEIFEVTGFTDILTIQ